MGKGGCHLGPAGAAMWDRSKRDRTRSERQEKTEEALKEKGVLLGSQKEKGEHLWESREVGSATPSRRYPQILLL